MRFSDLYSGTASPDTQAVSQDASTARSTSPQSQPVAAMPNHHAAVSWVGVIIALVLLRVVYEVSE